MASATLTGIRQRVEGRRTMAGGLRLPWAVITTAGLALAICFAYAAWQQFVALQQRYENQKWEAQRRELVAQRERLLVERAARQSHQVLIPAARKLGLVAHNITADATAPMFAAPAKGPGKAKSGRRGH